MGDAWKTSDHRPTDWAFPGSICFLAEGSVKLKMRNLSLRYVGWKNQLFDNGVQQKEQQCLDRHSVNGPIFKGKQDNLSLPSFCGMCNSLNWLKPLGYIKKREVTSKLHRIHLVSQSMEQKLLIQKYLTGNTHTTPSILGSVILRVLEA